MILLDKAIEYAEDVVNGEEVTTWEVETQCKWFFEDLKKQENEELFIIFSLSKSK